jgi:hypothetical protein
MDEEKINKLHDIESNFIFGSLLVVWRIKITWRIDKNDI